MTAAACTMRTTPSLKIERRLWKGGCNLVAGLDEAGRGALAGPIAVGAVMLPPQSCSSTKRISGGKSHRLLQGVRDSKQMTPRQRDAAAEGIRRYALAWSVGFASAEEIDSDGVVQAVRLAALRALENLGVLPDYLLTDFRLELPELGVSQTSLVRGDAMCMSIAAASVLAKTARDALMQEMDDQVPGYGLAKHKGYGTLAHRMALKRMGRSPIHRKTFSMGLLS
jgi:ribonuclease HII